MSGKKNLATVKFGFLTALKALPRRESGSVVWECECSCGNHIEASASSLRAGKYTSCGCHLKLGIHNYKEKFSIDEKGCWIWKGRLTPSGYGRYVESGKQLNAHRAFYELFKDKIPSGLLVCHTCDVRNCVNPDHLFLGSQKDNIADCINKGRHKGPHGSKHHAAKLTEGAVREIKSYLKEEYSKERVALLSNKLAISSNVIKTIYQNKAWKHVTL